MKFCLCEAANKSHSLFINVALNEGNGEKYTKLVISILKRDSDNKAVQTVTFFLDFPLARLWFTDLAKPQFEGEMQQFKSHHDTQRGIKVTARGTKVRLSILEQKDSNKKSLYLELDREEARTISLEVLCFLENYFRCYYYKAL